MSRIGKLSFLVFFMTFLLEAQVHANKFDNEGNFCRIQINSHELMVSIYQPETSGGDVFCSNLPALSKSVVAFDLVNEKLRNTPLEIKLIELSGKPNQTAEHHGKTVAAIPLDRHTSGSVQFTFTPKKSERYTALITVHEEGNSEQIAFPITIAKTQFTIAPSTLTATALSLMTLGVIFIFVRPLITKALTKRSHNRDASK